MKSREKIKKIGVLDRRMKETELRKIYLDLGDLVRYKREKSISVDKKGREYQDGSEIEHLFYNDEWSWIVGWNMVGEEDKNLEYWVEIRRVDLYCANLRSSDNEFARRLSEELKNRPRKEPDGLNMKLFVGKDYNVENYNDLPELVKLHRKILSQ